MVRLGKLSLSDYRASVADLTQLWSTGGIIFMVPLYSVFSHSCAKQAGQDGNIYIYMNE